MKIKSTLTAIEQLDIIIDDVQNLLNHKLDFNAFITIIIGIEYLGNFSDSDEFTEYENSRIRFNNGLDRFKDKWYSKNKVLLFEELRGPLIHQYRTGEKLLLTSNCVQNAPVKDHKQKTPESQVILVIEQLFVDFKEACLIFKKEINKPQHNFCKKKIESDYFELVEIKSPTQDITYDSSATTITYLSEDIDLETGKPMTRKKRRKLEREAAKLKKMNQ